MPRRSKNNLNESFEEETGLSNHPANPAASPVDVKAIWTTALSELERKISKSVFENWVRHTRVASIQGDTVIITAPNVFSVQTIQARYIPDIEFALSDILARPVRAKLVLAGHEHTVANGEGETAAEPEAPRSRQRTPAKRREPASSPPGGLVARQRGLEPNSSGGLNPRLRFENYVVGSSNEYAYAAAQAVAEHPGQQFNPLFIHGGVGLGKTHLLHAVGHRALELNPDLAIQYVTSETFTNEVINAIRTQKMEDFRTRYRSIDILMIDDVQFIAGKESTQEEFFHTFNALYQNGKHIILSSDKPPRAIAALEERMRSRFEGGIVADVQLPDYEMRAAILRAKAEELKVNLPDEVVQYISTRDQTNIRELEGALNKILMMAQLYRRPLTLQLAMESLTDSAVGRRRADTTMQDVIDAVVAYYKVTEKALAGRERKRDIVVPRQVAMYLMREATGASLVDIGRQLGGRDHTTVMHSLEKVEQGLEKDSTLRAQVMAIRESLLTK